MTDYEQIHQGAFLADLHCDTVLQMRRGYDISVRHDDYHIDIPRLQDGGVNLQVFACSVNPFEDAKSPLAAVNAQLDLLDREFDRNIGSMGICYCADDALHLNRQGKISALLAIEGGGALESNPANIEHLFKRGVRLITIVHEESTGWCTSHKSTEPTPDDLNELGREMISEMNRLGMIIDLSHASVGTFWRVLDATTAPVVASHSCPAAFSDHTRNLSDDQIRVIADCGGVIGIGFIHMFLSEEFRERSNSFWAKYPEEEKELMRLFLSLMPEDEKARRYSTYNDVWNEHSQYVADVRPTVSTVADAIDYVADLAGVDCVALGSDYDGMTLPPIGLEDCSGYPNLTKELVKRGYSGQEIERILGGNFLRVFKKVVPG
ncbi:MAG: dipeptidase [Candidatus Zixiibacteriota bacterium]|nr:MAG: dipeptidase [candidate division Zixibacteria bacterium]